MPFLGGGNVLTIIVYKSTEFVVYRNSAFIGFTSIIILFPVPGYLASKMQVINTKKMEKVS